MSAKGSSSIDARAELAELVKRKSEIAVSIVLKNTPNALLFCDCTKTIAYNPEREEVIVLESSYVMALNLKTFRKPWPI